MSRPNQCRDHVLCVDAPFAIWRNDPSHVPKRFAGPILVNRNRECPLLTMRMSALENVWVRSAALMLVISVPFPYICNRRQVKEKHR